MPEMLLTVDQTAERLQIHPVSVRRYLQSGRLRGIKRGNLWRVPESAIMESASSSKIVPSGQAEKIWRMMIDPQTHNEAIARLAQAPDSVRAEVVRRSGEVAAKYYATPEGEAELADWRALDGEPFHDDQDDDQ